MQRLHARSASMPLLILAAGLGLDGPALARSLSGTAGASAWTVSERAATPPHADGGGADATVGDPLGDAFGGANLPSLDLSAFSATTDGTSLILRLDFFTPISPVDSGEPNAMGGYIDLDVDQDPMTGVDLHVGGLCPQPAGLGLEYYVDLFSYNSTTGLVEIEDDTATVAGFADAMFSPMSVEISVPLSVLGMDDGIADTAAVVGNVMEPTDCVPNGGFLTSDVAGTEPSVLEIPTLDSWGLAVLTLLLSVAAAWTLRSASRSCAPPPHD